MQDLYQLMTTYGADMKGAMERFLDDMELYQSCLGEFLADPGFDQLKEALAAKDYEAAFNAAHSLKGVSGNMGLTPLFNAVCNIVEPLRARQYNALDEKFQIILQERARLESILNS